MRIRLFYRLHILVCSLLGDLGAKFIILHIAFHTFEQGLIRLLIHLLRSLEFIHKRSRGTYMVTDIARDPFKFILHLLRAGKMFPPLEYLQGLGIIDDGPFEGSINSVFVHNGYSYLVLFSFDAMPT